LIDEILKNDTEECTYAGHYVDGEVGIFKDTFVHHNIIRRLKARIIENNDKEVNNGK